MNTPNPHDITRILNDGSLTDSEKIHAIGNLTRPTMDNTPWDNRLHHLRLAAIGDETPPVYAAMLFPADDDTRIFCQVDEGGGHITTRFIDRAELHPVTNTNPYLPDPTHQFATLVFPKTTDTYPPSGPADAPGDAYPATPPTLSPETHTGPTAPEKYYRIRDVVDLTGYSREYIRRLHAEGYLEGEIRAPVGGTSPILHVSHSALIEGGLLDVDGRKGVTVADAARTLGVNPPTITRRIDRGEIRAIRPKEPKAKWRVVLSTTAPADPGHP